MNKLEYVSFDLAKALKELQFDYQCNAYYDQIGDDLFDACGSWVSNSFTTQPTTGDFYCTAPELELAKTWFRTIHHIHIEIYSNHSGWGWILTKLNGTTIKEITNNKYFKTYETALTSGLFQTINYIKTGK
jgi:hypothetical protein